MKIEAGLSLGTNLGDRLALLAEAKRRIAAAPGMEVLAQSPVYETEPVGVKPEYRHLKFLNAVLIVQGCCAPHECFDRLREIENDMGRKRSLDQYAPRPIDIDLIYADAMTIQSGGLSVPHPHWSERRFVVQPLADVRPGLILPGQSKTVAEILRDLPPAEKVVKYADSW
ncbi:MAG TPA: 2-amino-4-hydroxy-6-hydroxymethyldihydropteridine diphosphokinase [Verrucomicrobia bacterium]|nr:MAG: 2-amino-4-hydroxy-6-hydroxymethyldihydropteridine diphosphokinase [Lentisphaerae bacterium GWF2_57_35]HBA84018.1 2-amino-4-hydroxy-6-hydroxymethyldihydropteridine diphosphokinase [Verrucomicrobiota bacterium]